MSKVIQTGKNWKLFINVDINCKKKKYFFKNDKKLGTYVKKLYLRNF